MSQVNNHWERVEELLREGAPGPLERTAEPAPGTPGQVQVGTIAGQHGSIPIYGDPAQVLQLTTEPSNVVVDQGFGMAGRLEPAGFGTITPGITFNEGETIDLTPPRVGGFSDIRWGTPRDYNQTFSIREQPAIPQTGDFVFQLHDGTEILRLAGDGTVLVRGREVDQDDQLVAGFRAWLQATGYYLRAEGGMTLRAGRPGPGGMSDIHLQGGSAHAVTDLFGCAIADPNWGYDNWTDSKNGAAASAYETAGTEEIAKLGVGSLFAKDAYLAMWCTGPKVATGDHVVVARAWGFEPVTMCPWVKTLPKQADIATGIGFWFQGAAEYLIICRRGKPKRRPGAPHVLGLLYGDDRVFYAPRSRKHSEKPLGVQEWLERTVEGPYVELFARSARAGWTGYGRDLGWNLTEKGVEPWVQPVS